jgi:two-component system, LytTR family, response regulator LytT
MLKVVIIEDEKHTAIDLSDTLLSLDSSIEIVTILSSVEQAVLFFKEANDIDLIFSDIQLPDGLSFNIFKAVNIKVPVIFCTAFNKYALEAFDVNGIDYLLKPFNNESVAKALDKYRSLKSNFAPPEGDLDKLIHRLEKTISRKPNSIIVYQGDKIFPVEISQIALFYLEDSYVFAYTFHSQRYILSQSLDEIEDLYGISFFRANRQFLVNRSAVKDASRYFNRKVLVNLKIDFPKQILIGKLKTTPFLEWLANN